MLYCCRFYPAELFIFNCTDRTYVVSPHLQLFQTQVRRKSSRGIFHLQGSSICTPTIQLLIFAVLPYLLHSALPLSQSSIDIGDTPTLLLSTTMPPHIEKKVTALKKRVESALSRDKHD